MRRGMSLIEVLLALGTLAVGILALVSVFIQGLKLTTLTSDVAAATEVGQEVMERIRLRQRDLGFSSIPNGTYQFSGWSGDAAVNGFPPAPYGRVARNHGEYTVVVKGAQPSAFLKTIEVEVFWKPAKKIHLETHLHP